MKKRLFVILISCLTFYSCNLLNSLINEKKSSEARLKSVELSQGNIDFNEDIYEYKLSFNNSVKQIDIIPSLKDEKAKIFYNNTLVTNKSPINITLSVGDNIVSLSIIAESGSFKTYVFTINRNIAIFSEITRFSINDISSDITGDKISLELPYGTDITSLSPKIELSNQGSYTPVDNVDFTNTVTYTTKSSDGSEKVYYVDIRTALPSTDSSLKELIINGESIPLQSGVFNYQYLYNSTNTSTSTLPVSMSTNNNNAEILEGNISSMTIKNPAVNVL